MKNKTLIEQSEFVRTLLEEYKGLSAKIDEITDFTSWEVRQKRIADARKQQAEAEAAKKAAEEKKPESKNDSTEYEGPSLSEQSEFIKTFLEGHAEEREKREARRLSQEIGSKKHGRWSDKERTKNPESYHGTEDRARTGSKGRNPGDPLLRKRGNRQASLDWKRKENSSTEYEGLSLSEQLDFIKIFLEGVDEGRMGDFVRKHKKKLYGAMAGAALAGAVAGTNIGDEAPDPGREIRTSSAHTQQVKRDNPGLRPNKPVIKPKIRLRPRK